MLALYTIYIKVWRTSTLHPSDMSSSAFILEGVSADYDSDTLSKYVKLNSWTLFGLKDLRCIHYFWRGEL